MHNSVKIDLYYILYKFHLNLKKLLAKSPTFFFSVLPPPSPRCRLGWIRNVRYCMSFPFLFSFHGTLASTQEEEEGSRLSRFVYRSIHYAVKKKGSTTHTRRERENEKERDNVFGGEKRGDCSLSLSL